MLSNQCNENLIFVKRSRRRAKPVLRFVVSDDDSRPVVCGLEPVIIISCFTLQVIHFAGFFYAAATAGTKK